MRRNPFSRPALVLAGAILLFSGTARAAGPYLQHFDAVALLPAPPAVGSAEDKADRDCAFEVYSTRTAGDVARAKEEEEFSVSEFAPDIGPSFTPEKDPLTTALIAEALAEAKPCVGKAKKTWNRPRPAVLEPVRFSHPVEMETSGSYPSGHSTNGTLMALVLAQIFPAHRDAILAKGRLIGWTRIEAGVHTPLDIYAGRVLGQALARALAKSPAFQADLAAAQAQAQAASVR